MLYFNSRPHEEVDRYQQPKSRVPGISTHDLTKRSTSSALIILIAGVFQLTTSRRGRQRFLSLIRPQMIFQLTTSRRGRQEKTSSDDVAAPFQLTTSRRGRHHLTIIQYIYTTFQLTTSRRGRPCAIIYPIVDKEISTHDLTKRSTLQASVLRSYLHISTHDLTKRSTSQSYANTSQSMIFQLTTSRRGRPNLFWITFLVIIISTHDLTKRST